MHQSTWLPLVTGMSALALATEDQWTSVANSNPEQIASALGWDLQTFQQLRAQFGIGDLRRHYLAQLPRQAQQGGMATTSGGYAHPAGQFPAAPTHMAMPQAGSSSASLSAQWSQQQQPVPGASIQSPSSAIRASPTPPTFRGIRNCVWQGRGSIANGTVVLLPQMHWARTSENNPEAQEATLVSQGSILRDLVQNGARNIFLEDFNPESVERFNQTHLLAKDDQQYAQRIEIARSARDKLLDNSVRIGLSRHLTSTEKDLLFQIGGAGVYCLSSQWTNSVAMLHSTQTIEQKHELVKQRLNFFSSHATPIMGVPSMTEQERQFVFERREADTLQNIRNSIFNTVDPVFLIYGAAHTFMDTFDRPDAPALYRKFDRTVPTPAGVVLPQ